MRPRLYRLRRGVSTAVRAVAFWCAILLPFSIGASLVAGASPSTVGSLLVGNVVALVVGHGYDPTRADDARPHQSTR